jgi:hypothetical protein
MKDNEGTIGKMQSLFTLVALILYVVMACMAILEAATGGTVGFATGFALGGGLALGLLALVVVCVMIYRKGL